jgi:hypothetical protein
MNRIISTAMRRLKKVIKSIVPRIVVDIIGAARQFRASHAKYPNLIFPKTFSEKLLRRALFDQNPLWRICADKYAVRDYVEQIAGSNILPQLYCLAADPRDIPFTKLPDRFVVKPTHGSGWVSIVRDRATLDIADLVSRCEYWLSQNYAHRHHERIYQDIPRRIIVEELIDDGTEGAPVDYKFYVFHGKVKMIEAIFGRFSNPFVYHCNCDWKQIQVGIAYPPANLEVTPPKLLNELIRVAEMLGKDLEFIRVDLYATDERIVFGELTTTPGAGLDRFHPETFDRYLGSLW